MYLEFFGLKDAPFRITPDTDFWFPGAQRGEILDALIYALSHGEGLTKVVGEVGSGKTMLLRVLLSRLPETVDSLYLANPTLSPDEMLAALLTDLGAAPQAGATRQGMLDQLNVLLLDKHQRGRRVVVFVEEAQAMALSSLEFLRLLTNLETTRDKLLQIVLFGQPELNELLAVTGIRQLKDRITLNLQLDPLPPAAVPAYLRSRLATAGYRGPDLFNAKTTQAIARYSSGLTRRINILADKALLAAYADQTHNVSLKHVNAAANDAELVPPKTQRKMTWGWLSAGMAAGLGLITFLGWLGVGSVVRATAVDPRLTIARRVFLPESAPSAYGPTQQALDWLRHAPPHTFVIQLDTSHDAAQASASLMALEKLSVPRPLRMFPDATNGGKTWAVVSGEFSERAQAEAALAALPSALRARGPFLRTVGRIRRTLATPAQQTS
ncbi:MAG: ExeA family protein [Thiobacillaceae bacterium]